MRRRIVVGDLRTYVVNLRRRRDRRIRMRRILPPSLNPTFTSDWDGLFDGHELTINDLMRVGYGLFRWRIESENPWWSRPLKLGEIGCTLAHLACWRDALTSSEPYILILEDDVILPSDFDTQLCGELTRIAARHRFDLLYLGRLPLVADQPIAPGIVAPGYSHCTFGYLLARPALDKLLATRLEKEIVPVDEFLPSLYSDHPRPDLRDRYPRQLRALALEPPLVRQLPKIVAGSDTEDSTSVATETRAGVNRLASAESTPGAADPSNRPTGSTH